MFRELEQINRRPKPFEVYTAAELWTDDHTSGQMLAYHLNNEVDLSSRRSDFIDRSIQWIASRFHVKPGIRVADFGCGPGLYTTRLARSGASVTGIDFSERSVSYARKTAVENQLAIQYVNQNYLEFHTDERFDLILLIMCDFCALSPSQRACMLSKFIELLRPGGAVLLDVYSLNAFEKRVEAASYSLNQLDGFWSPSRYYGFLNTFKYPDDKVVLDKYTIIENDRTRTIYNWLQYFSPDQLQQEFETAGFQIESFFSDVAGMPFDVATDEYAIVGKK